MQMITNARISTFNKLSLNTKNRIRGILALKPDEAIEPLNKLREEKNVAELLQIERVLRLNPLRQAAVLPLDFPSKANITEEFHRLKALPFEKELQLLEGFAKEHYQKLIEFFYLASSASRSILRHCSSDASIELADLYQKFGYSHFLFRKAFALRSKVEYPSTHIPQIEQILLSAGLDSNNIVLSSLLHCFNEEQDYLSFKRSILNIPQRGNSNRFTRDICRIPFHPCARDEADLSELLYSSRQSSLIDAIIIAKANFVWWETFSKNYPTLSSINESIDTFACPIDEIAAYYLTNSSEGEYTFLKHSTAWLENADIVRYRMLVDNFYDAPLLTSSELPTQISKEIDIWIKPISLDELATTTQLTNHNYPNLISLEIQGTVTRSALFNYLINKSTGYNHISETNLFTLMGLTRDLAKTVNPTYLSNLATVAESKLSRLVLYFLIAKRSKNELDDHTLRRILQDVVINQHNRDLVKFFNDLRVRSVAVAEYAYDVCTEDFIAKLFKIIRSASEITETRAHLHRWMGENTGEKVYLDRARTLLIDHQLNKIRNEIDDNRIYVDAGRFAEWMNDEVMRELNGILSSTLHKLLPYDVPEPQLISIIERSYASFCSNKIFGIASYLGRRIRHGTFKGQLFSSVIATERLPKYQNLLSEPSVSASWDKWKIEYESKVDEIIRTRIHIESADKRDGLLKPTIQGQAKFDAMAACARSLLRDFSETNSTLNATTIMTEYCWRIAEFDLKAINSFLKNQRATLLDTDQLNEIKTSSSNKQIQLARDFYRDINRVVDEKLKTMYNWFKKPVNVAPKASLSLLYKAVVMEVKENFPDFETNTDFIELDDIELIGGAYHLIYDCMYVIVFNAAKHGAPHSGITRSFNVITGLLDQRKILKLNFVSVTKESESDDYVNMRLHISPSDDLTDAQVSEDRSGIRKLYHLQQCNSTFHIGEICCKDGRVNVELYYVLEH